MAAAMEVDAAASGGTATRLRRLLLNLPSRRAEAAPDQARPLLVSATPSAAGRKGGLALLRGLSCTSAEAAGAYAPHPPPSAAAAVVRASADWQTRRPKGRRRVTKGLRRKDRERHQHYVAPPPPLRRNVATADLWCSTGIAFGAAAAADDSVDCVVPSRQRRWASRDGERIQRGRPFVGRSDQGRHVGNLSSFLDSSSQSDPDTPYAESDEMLLYTSRYRSRRFNAPVAGGLEELMIFPSTSRLGEMGVHDQHSDWRLDVDNMTYEELLELSDKIGYVNTGLTEEEIFQCLRKMKHSLYFSSLLELSAEMEKMCSICQEEYKVNDEVGKLECGHCYHLFCIRRWLLQKNICPVCKTAAA